MQQMRQDNFGTKSDDEIYQAALEEWISVLVRLWDAVGKPLDIERLQIYQRELSAVPMGLLELAVSRVIRENTYMNVPTVGAVWGAVRAELGNPFDVMQEIESWKERQWKRVAYFGHSNVAVETEA